MSLDLFRNQFRLLETDILVSLYAMSMAVLPTTAGSQGLGGVVLKIFRLRQAQPSCMVRA